MGCSLGHPAQPRERVVPGLFRCLARMTVLLPQSAGPGGPVHSVPTAYPHGELYYDASVEPIAVCSCGRYAAAACGSCRRYRCLECQPTGQPVCAACAAIVPSTDVLTRKQVLDLVARIPDPNERLFQAAMVLEHEPGPETYPALYQLCPFLPVVPRVSFWEPLEPVFPPGSQWVPWDSGTAGRWFAGRAAMRRLAPLFQVAEGRVFAQISYGWRLIAGSTVRLESGFTDTAF